MTAKFTSDVGYTIHTNGVTWYPIHKTKRGRVALAKSQKDAQLFAASADLLEALELCLHAVCLAGWEGDLCAEKARAAIKKATGENK